MMNNERKLILSILYSLILLGFSFIINLYAIRYATESASNSVTDIVLSNVPVVDVDALFVGSTVVVILFTIFALLKYYRRIPFALKSLALFILIRSIFVMLTHIGPFPSETERTSYVFLNKLLFGADSFFSGHTGMPYLGALVFWDAKWVRYLFISSSVFFGVLVLLGHIHYTIDVVGAFFITYSIFKICELFFNEEDAISSL